MLIKFVSQTDMSVSIVTDKGEARLIFNEDGSFRLVSNLKTSNLRDVKADQEKSGAGDGWIKLVQVEDFGYPTD